MDEGHKERISRIMKSRCKIHQLIRIGESSSDAVVYGFDCNGERLAAKIWLNGPKLDREYELMKSLNDTGIVPKVITLQNDILVMQRIPMSLARWLTVAKEDQLLGLAVNLVVKLKTFHSLGYVHGDLHTNNILVDPHANECYIIDFTRRATDGSIIGDLTTLQDSFYGFPLDMASELYGYQSDQYYAIQENIWFFEHQYVMYVKDLYDITLIQEQEQQQQQEQEVA